MLSHCLELNKKIEFDYELIEKAFENIYAIEEDIVKLYKQINDNKQELNKKLKMLFKDEYIKFGIETGYLEDGIKPA